MKIDPGSCYNLPPMREPLNEYESRLAERTAEGDRLRAQDRAISNMRLAVFAIFVAAGWIAWVNRSAAAWIPFAPLAIFVILVVIHQKLRDSIASNARLVALYGWGVTRMTDAWAGKGNAGARFANPAHPYADDLDLFGTASLFERICVTRTPGGEARLAAWLMAPAEATEARARQLAVAELADDLELREQVTLAGDELQSSVDAEQLSRWASEPNAPFSPAIRWLATALGAAGVPALALALPSFFVSLVGLGEPALASSFVRSWPALAWGHLPLLALMVAQAAFAFPLRARVLAALQGVERAGTDLRVLSELLGIVESRTFVAPRLSQLRGALISGDVPASEAISRLERLVELLDSVRNVFFVAIAPVLLWRTNLAIRVVAWRERHGADVARWIDSAADLEALLSLAAWAFEKPGHAYPEIVEGPPRVEATALGHPLIPADRRIDNDVAIGSPTRLLIVSGSNMSGKSTMMRAIGVNSVLALAGAPVCAAGMRLTAVRIGASIRINDSLAAGQSKFYAEILRLRQIVDMTGEGPGVLFLLDEILHGTNSHDRLIGAEAVIRTLVSRSAIGLVSTHDLALARMADDLGELARNVHFEDHMEGDRMVFDYRMRDGIVAKSNALALMRAVGLDIEEAKRPGAG
ncbi:MAG: DNA mismatch repair protein MutS [Thermoanaerobaculia bacterium]|nr:DNA mismatch repair protein MutS [Thermoanaerobaculia bacterium]